MNPAVIILSTIFLILLNAFFSAIEIALVSLSENRINLEIKKGIIKASKIKKIKEKPTNFLSVIQIMIHIITFIQGAILNNFIIQSNNLFWKKCLIQLIVISLSIIFGEILPKRISLISPLKTVYLLFNFFYFISFLTKPIVGLLNKISNIFLFLFRIDKNKKNDSFAEEELRFLLHSSYRKGIIDRSENNMIQNIFDFDETVVSEIMRHRKEIVAIKSDITQEELINFISKEKYTRFPVYEENIDKIIGIVHVKDIFKSLLKKINNGNEKDILISRIKNQKNIFKEDNISKKKFNIKDLIRKAYYVLEFKNISELFKEMQLNQNHIAIVIDEYGGTSGIVTIEDVIEEILGDIKDEYDNKQKIDIAKISEKEYIAEGTAHLYEIEEHLKADLPINDYDTLSGFMLGQLKRIPESNEKIKIVYKNWQFDGLAHNELVITKIKITKIDNQLLTTEQK
ncbi:transporter associated domain protein [Candidatus Phytoplasma oryzae]|uniref:Hemolysin n=1 Tax=Candidatus Phytoplasma oryzae TaxID=203274 RepID=A0A139JQA4_9MOLU|nr:hemolysin family protein [Candidatus Phytoplasma oryzae]KXT29143.1 transporter associated domain protein [Candidatus Phytoplasma oryzae]RAM57751.1 hemolysin [Candidatus Phytoplasma oryzae]